MLELKDPQVAASFQATTDVDQWIWVPFPRGQGPCYKGFLSEITLKAATRYVELGANLLVRKETPAGQGDAEEEAV